MELKKKEYLFPDIEFSEKVLHTELSTNVRIQRMGKYYLFPVRVSFSNLNTKEEQFKSYHQFIKDCWAAYNEPSPLDEMLDPDQEAESLRRCDTSACEFVKVLAGADMAENLAIARTEINKRPKLSLEEERKNYIERVEKMKELVGVPEYNSENSENIYK